MHSILFTLVSEMHAMFVADGERETEPTQESHSPPVEATEERADL